MRHVVLAAKAAAPLAGGGTPRPPHPLGRRHGRGDFFWGALIAAPPDPPASVFHGIVSTLVGLGLAGWFLRGFLGVFSVRPLAFFPPFGWLARLAVWPSVLCVLVSVWLSGVAPLLPCRVGSVVGSLVWLVWSGSAVAIAFFCVPKRR